jgi:hypothetical protein
MVNGLDETLLWINVKLGRSIRKIDNFLPSRRRSDIVFQKYR